MMHWLASHIRAVVLAFVLLTFAGIGAALNLPVSLFPHIDFPRVVVSIDAGERSADQMAVQITRPIEQALRSVPGVTLLRSTTSRGSAEVAVGFDWGQDMVAATLQTQAALSGVLPSLPAGTQFSVRRSDPTIFPVLGLALSSASRDPVSLRSFAELQLRPLISAVPGVAGVDILGGRQAEYEVSIDPARLQALGLSMSDVSQAIGANNGVQAVGRMEDRHRLYLALVDSRLMSLDDIGAIAIKTGSTPGAGVVSLKAVASIKLAQAPEWTRVTAQGRDAVLINVRQSPTADSVALVKAVRAKLADYAAQTPSDVKIATFYDQSELVTGAATSVRDAILLGAFLAGLVLFLFMRSLRLMVITALLLPAVLATACLLLLVLHMSFNMMTLGGMAAAVGLIVDDIVVMLEHLMRRLQEGADEDVRPSMLDAAAEMARPLIGATLSTVVVFVPLAFISGVTGGFFQALAVTMTATLIISLLYVLFVAPLLGDRWLTRRDAMHAEKAASFMNRLTAGYDRMARGMLARPLITGGIVAVVLLCAGGFALTRVGSGFMPRMDEGGFILDYKAAPGSALTDTDRLLRQLEAIIQSTPEVDSYSRRTGFQLGGGLTEADEGDFFIRLKPGRRRDIETVMAEVRQRMQHDVPGLDIETAQLMEDLIGDLTAVPQPIEIKLFGSDTEALRAAAATVAPAIEKIPGVVEVRDGLRVAGDAVLIHVNRPAAALAGLDPDTVARQLETLVGGSVATQIQQGQILLGVRVRAPAGLRDHIESLRNLHLRAADGHEVLLSQVADVTIEAGQRQITREDLEPLVAVTARLEGRDLGSAMREVRKTVAGLHLPATVRVEYGGTYAQQQKSFADLSIVFVSALMLVSLLLVYLYERWTVVLGVLGVVLLSAAAVLIGLWLTGTELNISALMGLTMVVGMVTELAVFYFAEIDFTQRIDREHLLEAGRARLRPIVMSALIAILALSPLALGLGRGSGLQQPLAIAIIFGLTAGAPLVLLLLPAMFSAVDRLQDRRKKGAAAPSGV
jgi:CzcA family heavy metal efflux pump